MSRVGSISVQHHDDSHLQRVHRLHLLLQVLQPLCRVGHRGRDSSWRWCGFYDRRGRPDRRRLDVGAVALGELVLFVLLRLGRLLLLAFELVLCRRIKRRGRPASMLNIKREGMVQFSLTRGTNMGTGKRGRTLLLPMWARCAGSGAAALLLGGATKACAPGVLDGIPAGPLALTASWCLAKALLNLSTSSGGV